MSGVSERAQDMKERIQDWWAVRKAPGGGITRLVIVLLAVYLLVALIVGMVWSKEPENFDVNAVADAIRAAVERHLDELVDIDIDDLLDRRYRRIQSFGRYSEKK